MPSTYLSKDRRLFSWPQMHTRLPERMAGTITYSPPSVRAPRNQAETKSHTKRTDLDTQDYKKPRAGHHHSTIFQHLNLRWVAKVTAQTEQRSRSKAREPEAGLLTSRAQSRYIRIDGT